MELSHVFRLSLDSLCAIILLCATLHDKPSSPCRCPSPLGEPTPSARPTPVGPSCAPRTFSCRWLWY